MTMFFRIAWVVCLVVGLRAAASGQTVNEGAWMVGGSAGLSVSNVADITMVTFGLNPSAGYFLQDDLAVGGQLGLAIIGGDVETTSAVSIVPFARYYFGSPFFAQAGIGLSSSEGHTESILRLMGGYSIFLNPAVSLEPVISIRFEDGFERSFILFGVGLQVFLQRVEK